MRCLLFKKMSYNIINMAGGLIQIAAYGSQDLFLTGTPEITFFKVVYRRHTNFSMESIRVTFDDPVSLGGFSVVKIPKVGDLMYKTYLEVLLPEMDLKRVRLPEDQQNEIEQATNDRNEAINNYELIYRFMSINRNAYQNAYTLNIAENSGDNLAGDMISSVNEIFLREGNQSIIDSTRDLLTRDQNSPFTYNEVSLESIANTFNVSSDPDEIFKALTIGINKSIITQEYYYNIFLTSNKNLEDAENNNILFAWVDRVGHAIIESLEVKIGGHKIDRHFGDWLNVWYELTANRDMEKIYFEMIGNVSELTTFDRVPKPKYLLKIPLQFWFCRFNGLAIPLVSLEYHNVSLHIKFRKLEELCYIEPDTNIQFSLIEDGITLDEVPEELGLDIDARLLIDYIYLDNHERRRFAQSSHEYLIEQLQVFDKANVTQRIVQFELNNFVHPSKELIWTAQQERFTMNQTGYNRCRWDNYSLTENNVGNIITFSSLDFHSYVRVPRFDGNYFNYVQPYDYHRTTPSDGINMYSFSIFPEEYQPSGAANLSRLSRITLNLEFSQALFQDNLILDPLIVRVYTRNLNILRFVSGFAALAFVYG